MLSPDAPQPTSQPSVLPSPSRRALLAGALGGLGAWATSAIASPSPTHAEGETIHVGQELLTAESVTQLSNTTNNADVFTATSAGSGTCVTGYSWLGTGVWGNSAFGLGVFGTSTEGVGIRGQSGSVQGVIGIGAIGVEGTSNSQYAWGVGGSNSVSGGIGVWGQAFGAGSRGVSGYSAAGRGVHGESSTGWAGYFDGRVLTKRYHELVEIGTPSAPASNHARLFVRDNGSGKTQLCVRFNTGAVKVLVTQA